MAFTGSRAACQDQSLLSLDETEGCKLHDPALVHAFLEIEIEIGKELPFGEPGILDPSFDAAFDEPVDLNGEEPLDYPGDCQAFGGGLGELGIKCFLDPEELEYLEVILDGWNRVVHRCLQFRQPVGNIAPRVVA